MAANAQVPGTALAHSLGRQLAALGLGCALALLLAEVGLRLAGQAWLSGSGRGPGSALGDDRELVLCCGDSNVFGLYADAQDAYPSRLQALLDQLERGPRHRVLNLGIPGMNSTQLAQGFAGDLDAYRPEAALVTVGANNIWSTTTTGLQRATAGWIDRLRLVRLWKLLRYSARAHGGTGRTPEAGDPSVEFFAGGLDRVTNWTDREGRQIELTTGTGPQLDAERAREALRADLAAMARAAQARGVRLILVGYGTDRDMYHAPNAILAEEALHLGLPFVSTHAQVEELAARLSDTQVYYPDYHPKGIGYEVVARLVLAELARLGLVEMPEPPAPLDGPVGASRAASALRLAGQLDGLPGSDEELRFEIRGELPGRRYTILLLASELPPGGRLDFEILARDPLLLYTFASGLLSGRLDERGDARVPLAGLVKDRTDLRGSRLRALYVLQGDSDPRVLLRMGDPLEFVVP